MEATGVVLDIEGTTSATAAVHGALFADARARLPEWVAAHRDEPDVAAALAATIATAELADDAPLDDIVAALTRWIDDDVKATPLKTIQGRIWAEGFADGRLRAHFFDDAAAAIRRWHGDGLRIAVFSSGSVTVQRPWFGANPTGDLTPFVDAWFDTVNAGPKREPASYARIADELARRWGGDGGSLVFLSDVPAELDAARTAGWQTVGVRRAGEPYDGADFGDHATITSFDDLRLAPSAVVPS